MTNEDAVPEMRIWSILLVNSDLKWCLYLIRSLFLYFHLGVIFALFAIVPFYKNSHENNIHMPLLKK